jgi:hypothetical protein
LPWLHLSFLVLIRKPGLLKGLDLFRLGERDAVEGIVEYGALGIGEVIEQIPAEVLPCGPGTLPAQAVAPFRGRHLPSAVAAFAPLGKVLTTAGRDIVLLPVALGDWSGLAEHAAAV